ncbi:MAG: DsbE family thiol:disulfide interchange protein [Pseudomonadota bacterium]
MSERRKFPLWAVIPLIVVIVMAGLFYAMLGRDTDTLPSALIDKPVPEFELAPLREGGEGLSTAALQEPGAKVVNVWASWCGPCRVEHPELMELSEMGVPVHGLNYKDSRENALKFLNELGDPYDRIGADTKGRAGIEWGVYGVPETFIVNGEGRIVHKHVGPIQNDDLEEKILPALRAAGWSPPEG